MLKKTLSIAVLIALGSPSFASDIPTTPTDYTISCNDVTSTGPFTKFQAHVTRGNQYEYFHDEIIAVSRIDGQWRGQMHSDGVTPIRASEKVLLWVSTKTENTLRFEFVDWASGTILIESDDEGMYASVRFNSDGPSMAGFYRCEQTLSNSR